MAMTDLAQVLCGMLVLLAPLAAAGLALMNSGLGRSRSAAHAMLAPLCVMAVAALVYCVCGWSWQSFPGRPAHAIAIAGNSWNWIAAEPFFLRGLALDGSPALLAAWLQMFSVGIAALIPLGAGSERWRLGASCASTAILAGWTYPLFAHWVWGGGWLGHLGVLDAGGAGTIQAVGGLTALAVAGILGPRQGKYDAEGLPAAFPGHNAVLVLFGCFLTWMGWIGLNGAGSILFTGATAGSIARIAMNTTLAAAAGLLAAAVLTRVRFGRPDASLCANGWTAGLVAGSGHRGDCRGAGDSFGGVARPPPARRRSRGRHFGACRRRTLGLTGGRPFRTGPVAGSTRRGGDTVGVRAAHDIRAQSPFESLLSATRISRWRTARS